jgi:hypothetical protein
MANSVYQDRHGPIWPLGNIAVPAPGTPVNIMSLVDPTNLGAPETTTPGTAGAPEYTNRCYAIIFQGFKAGAAPPRLAANTGVIYIVRKTTTGVADVGNVIAAIRQTDAPFVLTAAALNRDSLSPYEFYIDADTAADGCQVTLLIQ